MGHFSSASGADDRRHRDPGGERQQPRRVADHDRAQQRAARRRDPRPALAAAARGLLARRHERPVRRAGAGELARALVGRVDDAQVEPRAAETLTPA